MTEHNLTQLSKQRTMQLLKRFDCKSADELERIASREYATDHFDITTVMLIVEAILEDALRVLPINEVAKLGVSCFKTTKGTNYGVDQLLSARHRELKGYIDNRRIHGTKVPERFKSKIS